MIFDKDYYHKGRFSKIHLENEKLSKIEFENCTFTNSTFISCIFQKCEFTDCVFKNCVISALIPTNSRFSNIKFEDSKVTGIDWTRATKIESLIFKNCQLDYSNFRMLKLPKISMTDCQIHDADFTDCDLTEANFSRSDLKNTRFFKTNLTKTNFNNAIGYDINTQHNIVKNAQFSLPEALNLLSSLDIKISD